MHRDDLSVEKSVTGAREIDRRTIAKGVAWTVPVVIVATAAPAAASSRMTSNPSLTSASLDTHLSGNPGLRLVGSCPANEAGQLKILLVTQGSVSRGVAVVIPLTAGQNSFDTTFDPGFVVTPSAVSVSYQVTDSGNVKRNEGQISAVVAPYSAVDGVVQSQQGSTKTFTFSFTNRNEKAALVISSVKSSTGGSWTSLSKTQWEDIGTGTVSFTAKWPEQGADAVVTGTIDGQPFRKTSPAI